MSKDYLQWFDGHLAENLAAATTPQDQLRDAQQMMDHLVCAQRVAILMLRSAPLLADIDMRELRGDKTLKTKGYWGAINDTIAKALDCDLSDSAGRHTVETKRKEMQQNSMLKYGITDDGVQVGG